MSMPELRPMGIGDILDATFRIYRQRFLVFLLIALIVYVPYAFLVDVFQMSVVTAPHSAGGVTQRPDFSVTGPAVRHAPPTPEINWAPFAVGAVGMLIFAVVLMPLCMAALMHNISASYLGENLSAGQSYARAAPRLLPLLGTQILGGLIVMLGLLLFIIPGIIFSLWFFILAPVVVLEGLAGTKALGRSRELMRGNLGKAFLLGLLVSILGGIIGGVLGAVAQLIPWPHPSLGIFFNTAVQAIVLPIQTAPVILLYYDLRIRKEAFDLQKLSATLGQPAAAQ
jgi:hypothetical protein